ncbi:flagellar protein FliO/FliZ [Evansella vedderi]|uniref:Flagellar protein n=1 Tax=Evansella vedderi TaxID=38282 RepID=A0ABT9ZR46_9BACI|nr:flagellar biosynthetic protein FliO [Evansella vedderi]MDQ0253701.1 flagellar protein FliO/FliZ [Evansella vedderi]
MGHIQRKVIIIITIFLFLQAPFLVSADDQDWEAGDGNVLDNLLRESTNNSSEIEDNEDEIISSPTNEDDSSIVVGGNDQNVFWLLFQMFLALAFILFLIYGLLKFINSKSRSFRSNSTIESIGGVPLGSNRSVQIVRVGKKLFVVGVGDSIQLIKEIDDPVEVERILEEHRPSEFVDQPVSKVINWWKEKASNSASHEDNRSFQHLLHKELKDVKESQQKVHSALKGKE